MSDLKIPSLLSLIAFAQTDEGAAAALPVAPAPKAADEEKEIQYIKPSLGIGLEGSNNRGPGSSSIYIKSGLSIAVDKASAESDHEEGKFIEVNIAALAPLFASGELYDSGVPYRASDISEAQQDDPSFILLSARMDLKWKFKAAKEDAIVKSGEVSVGIGHFDSRNRLGLVVDRDHQGPSSDPSHAGGVSRILGSEANVELFFKKDSAKRKDSNKMVRKEGESLSFDAKFRSGAVVNSSFSGGYFSEKVQGKIITGGKAGVQYQNSVGEIDSLYRAEIGANVGSGKLKGKYASYLMVGAKWTFETSVGDFGVGTEDFVEITNEGPRVSGNAVADYTYYIDNEQDHTITVPLYIGASYGGKSANRQSAGASDNDSTIQMVSNNGVAESAGISYSMWDAGVMIAPQYRNTVNSIKMSTGVYASVGLASFGAAGKPYFAFGAFGGVEL